MKDLDVDDWYQLRLVANDRLSPDGIAAWFFAVLLYSGIVLIITIFGYSQAPTAYFRWYPIIVVLAILLIIDIFLFLYFNNSKYMYTKQKIQSVFLCIYGTEVSVEMYIPAFMSVKGEPLEKSIIQVGLIALIGGLLLLFIATIRGVQRVGKGYFRKDGNGLYDFKEKSTKSFVGIYIIYPCVMAGMIIFRSIQNNNFQSAFLLFWVIFVQYSISLALPEFYLLMYCKFKYKEFTVEMPEWYKKRMAEKKKAKLMKKQRLLSLFKGKTTTKKQITKKHKKAKSKRKK